MEINLKAMISQLKILGGKNNVILMLFFNVGVQVTTNDKKDVLPNAKKELHRFNNV